METKGKFVRVDAKPYRVVSCNKCGRDGLIERNNNFVSKDRLCKKCDGNGYVVYANREILRKQITGILFLVTMFLVSGLILLGLYSSWIVGLFWGAAVLILFGLTELLHRPIRERIEDYHILTANMTAEQENKAIEEYKSNIELEKIIAEVYGSDFDDDFEDEEDSWSFDDENDEWGFDDEEDLWGSDDFDDELLEELEDDFLEDWDDDFS